MTNLKTLSAAMAFVLSMLSASPLYAQSNQQPTLTPYQRALKAAAEEAVDYLDEATITETEAIIKKTSQCKAAMEKLSSKHSRIIITSTMVSVFSFFTAAAVYHSPKSIFFKGGVFLLLLGSGTLAYELFTNPGPTQSINWDDFPQEEKWETIALFALMEAGLPRPNAELAYQKVIINIVEDASKGKKIESLDGKSVSYTVSLNDLKKSHEKINAEMRDVLNKHCSKK